MTQKKIYHIVHIDKLKSIISDNFLWCDAKINHRETTGTIIGMDTIKQRRLKELKFNNYPNLYVGDCVPFYFCPRSIMLYIIYKANNRDLTYVGGQNSIIHLESDLKATTNWAYENNKRWVFTLSNAGSRYFQDRCDLSQLNEINWKAIQATDWRNCIEEKQAEFLIEECFPWELVKRIGVYTDSINDQVSDILKKSSHSPFIETIPNWYY